MRTELLRPDGVTPVVTLRVVWLCRTMRETSVIAPTAPCGRADPSAFYGDPDLPHLAAPSQASECHWHRSYHRDSSLTQAMALPSVPISEPTWLPNNIVRCGRFVLGGDGHRHTAHYIVSWCNGQSDMHPSTSFVLSRLMAST